VARIKDSSVEAVRQGADFVAVVEERTPLRKSGGRLTGRCPFHEERTPSFSVNPAKGLYHCFGCGKGGDMIRFVEETQGLDFAGAIEWLGERFRIPIEYEESGPGEDVRRQRRKRLYELLDQAATFYERLLWDSPGGSLARDYLAGRAHAKNLPRFRLGLAPPAPADAQGARSFTTQRQVCWARAGDHFQRRFSRSPTFGRVVGFQRAACEGDTSTRRVELFVKGAVNWVRKAREAIAKEVRMLSGNIDGSRCARPIRRSHGHGAPGTVSGAG
jgi:hypothetical protein